MALQTSTTTCRQEFLGKLDAFSHWWRRENTQKGIFGDKTRSFDVKFIIIML